MAVENVSIVVTIFVNSCNIFGCGSLVFFLDYFQNWS
jgi:hypothetical protein